LIHIFLYIFQIFACIIVLKDVADELYEYLTQISYANESHE